MKVTMRPFIFPLILAVLAGCAGKDSPVNEGGVTTAPVEATNENPLKIPAELVTGGARYMGYPFSKKVVYKMTGFPAGQSSEQTVVPTYDAENKAVTLNYQGEPSFTSETYEFRADGMYGTLLGGNEVDPPMLAMAAEPTIGKSWPLKGTLKQGDGMKVNTVVRVDRREKVKVPAGEYDALLLTEEGTISVGTMTFKVSGKGWYVEGIGAVKRTISQTDSAGKTSNITIEAATIQ
jgi:hypothetical protein